MCILNAINHFMLNMVLIWICHFANLAIKKQLIDRRGCKQRLERQADKMLTQSQYKFPPVYIGVLIKIPEVCHGDLAPRNVLANTIEKTDQDLYILGTKNVKLKRL